MSESTGTTSGRIQVPSPDFWTITPFTMAAPDGWSAKQTVDHLVYLASDEDPGSNCGVMWRRVSRQLSLQQIGAMSWKATQRTSPDATLQYSKFVRVNGIAAYLRLATISKPSGDGDDRTACGQMYAAIHGPDFGSGRPIELFEVVGHFDPEHPNGAGELEQILGSFEFVNVVRPDATSEAGDAESKGA